MPKIPIHPLLVHFPIAFYLLESLLLWLWLFRKEDKYRELARLVFFLAFAGMGAAIVAGLYDARGVALALKHARAHFLSAMGLTFFCLMRAGMWVRFPKSAALWHAAFSGIGAGLVILTAYFGGLLVYG